MEDFKFYLQRFADLIEGTDGDDNISNIDDNVSIDAKGGNDSIQNFASNVTIIGGAGDDSLYDGADWEFSRGTVYIYGGGNDTIERFRNDDNFLIIEGYGWETIGSDDTGHLLVNVLDGTETVGSITLKDYYALTPRSINILSSKEEFAALNLIINDEDNQTLTGTNAKNVISNTGKNVSIVGGSAKDSIFDSHNDNASANVIIDAGAGNNFIYSAGASNVTIKAGAGNDYVISDNWFEHVGEVYVYGGGNDTLTDFGWRNFVVLGDVEIKSDLYVEGVGRVLRLSNGNTLTMTGDTSASIVSSLDEVPKINYNYNEESNVVVTGTQENGTVDFILNRGSRATINGSANNDIISNTGEANNVVINGEAGNDDMLVDAFALTLLPTPMQMAAKATMSFQ